MNALISKFQSVRPNKNGNIDPLDNEILIQALRWFDTVHDFYPVSSTARGEDIREILSKHYDPSPGGTYSLDRNNGVKKFMSAISTIAPSSVEEDTENYYNKTFNTIMVGRKTIDVKKVMNSFGDKDAKTFLAENGISDFAEEADLQLMLTDRSGFKNIPNTNYLANVILTFFFGADINQKVYFLIDANSGRLDCMFQDIEQASILINVLTIGDSANTKTDDSTDEKESATCGVSDFNNKYKRKTYLHNPFTVPYNKLDVSSPVNNKYEIKSTEFTKDKLELWYQSVPGLEFTKQNNASIRYCVKHVDHPNPWYTEFSVLSKGNPNSGASVGTLKKLILILDTVTPTNVEAKKQEIFKFYKTVNQLNLAKILFEMLDAGIDKADIISFLYDYKRAGDHEQVNSANYLYRHETMPKNVILVTGDRLCSLYARLIKQPCIYTHKKYYDMYRFLREITPEQQRTQAEFLLKNSIDTIPPELNDIDTDIIKAKIVELENMINDEWTSSGEELEDKLYALVFKSLKVKIGRLKNQAEKFDTERETLSVSIREIPIPDDTTTTESLTASSKTLIDDYMNFKNKFKEILDFNSYIEDELKSDKKKFNSNALDYDNKIVKNIIKYFIDFEKGILAFKTRDNKRIAEKRTFINSLGGEKYNILMTDFIVFINKCHEYIGSTSIDTDLFTEASNKIKLEINEKIAFELNQPNVESHPYENYRPVVVNITEFFEEELRNVNTDVLPMEVEAQPEAEAEEPEAEEPEAEEPEAEEPEAEEPEAEEPEAVVPMEEPEPAETTTPMEEESVLSERPETGSMEEEEESLVPSSGGGKTIKEEIEEKNEEIVRIQNDMFKFMKIHLCAWLDNSIRNPALKIHLENKCGLSGHIISVMSNFSKNLYKNLSFKEFETILNIRLKYEYYLYYGDIQYLEAERRGANLLKDYINPLLSNFKSELIESHQRQLVDAFFDKMDHEELSDDEIQDMYKFMFNECIVYENDIYDLIYYADSVEDRHKKRKEKRKNEEEHHVPDINQSIRRRRSHRLSEGGKKKRTRKYKNKRNKKTLSQNKKTRKNKTLKIKKNRNHRKTRRH
jgi:hypothetical protein